MTAGLLRLVSNLFDVIGLTLVGLIAYLIANTTKPLSQHFLGFEILLSIVDVPLLAILSVTTFLLKSFFSAWFSIWFANKVSQIETELSKKIISSYYGANSTIVRAIDSSTFQATLMNSVNALVSGILNPLLVFVSEGALLLLLVFGFLYVNTMATIALVIYLAAVTFVITNVVNKRIINASHTNYKASKQFLRVTKDYFLIFREAQLAQTTRQWAARTLAEKEGQIRAANYASAISSMPRIFIETSLIFGVFAFLGIVVLVSDIPSQAVTIGIFLVGGLRLISAILPLQAAVTTYRQSTGSTSDAINALRLPTKQFNVGVKRVPDEPTLVAHNLEYQPGSNFKLKSMNFEFKFGQRVAIVGLSGAGKSTLAELILGFKAPTSGFIGIERDTSGALHESKECIFGYVPQRPQILTGTLAENVTLKINPDSREREQIRLALQDAGLWPLVETLPNGIDTALGDSGQNLSGGETQRLGLARAFYLNPKVLVLDEATSALDLKTEQLVMDALNSKRGTMTQVIITHKLKTVSNSDIILYLDKGEISASGTFDELYSKSQAFRDLVEQLKEVPRKN